MLILINWCKFEPALILGKISDMIDFLNDIGVYKKGISVILKVEHTKQGYCLVTWGNKTLGWTLVPSHTPIPGRFHSHVNFLQKKKTHKHSLLSSRVWKFLLLLILNLWFFYWRDTAVFWRESSYPDFGGRIGLYSWCNVHDSTMEFSTVTLLDWHRIPRQRYFLTTTMPTTPTTFLLSQSYSFSTRPPALIPEPSTKPFLCNPDLTNWVPFGSQSSSLNKLILWKYVSSLHWLLRWAKVIPAPSFLSSCNDRS